MKNRQQIPERLAIEIKTIGLLPALPVREDFDKDLLISGLIDSFGFVQFMMFVESEYGISIGEELQFDERIRTINGMTAIIEELSK